MMTCLITVLILAVSLGNGFCSVLSFDGLYCTDSGLTNTIHAVPGTTISITCATDSPDGIASSLVWTIPQLGVTITNSNGDNASDENIVSTVTSFNNTDGTTNATLTFTATSELDGYEVTCRSAVLSSTQTCTLYILTLPSAPLNPTCTNPTVSSVTIEWSPPNDNGGENITYAVTVTPDDISNTTAMTSFLVSDLTPLTEYTFTVRASNTVGYSVENVTVMCSTPGEGVNSQIQFQPDTTQHCDGEPVEYQCSIDTLVLTWSVLQNNGTQFGIDATYTLNSNTEPNTIEGVFMPERLSAVMMSPLVTNISFTAQSSINGYTIVCQNGINLNNKNVTITVITPSDSPGSVLVDTNSFTNSSVAISWTASPSVCNTIFTYSVNTTNDTTTSNSTVLEGLVPSDDNYCVTVTATDYTTRTSEQCCFRFSVPEPPLVHEPILINTCDPNGITIEWKPTHFNIGPDITVPTLSGYRVTLENITDLVSIVYHSPLLPPDSIQYNFTNVSQGRLYTVTVIAVNGVGDSSPTNRTITVPGEIIAMSTTTTTITMSTIVSTITSSTGSYSTVTVTPSSCQITSNPNELSTSVSAGISVAITVPVTAIITAIITIIIMYIVYSKHNKQQYNTNISGIPSEYETPIKTTALEMNFNTAYSDMQYKTNTNTGASASGVYETVITR